MSAPHQPSVLVLGCGNPSRQDDGLGPAAVAAVSAWNLAGVTADADFQFLPEDAADVARYDMAIFVDAAAEGPDPFRFEPLAPAEAPGGFSHHLEPPAVLGLARSLFGARTRAFVLAIRGHAFDAFAEGLSARARANLEAALDFLRPRLEEPARWLAAAPLEETRP